MARPEHLSSDEARDAAAALLTAAYAAAKAASPAAVSFQSCAEAIGHTGESAGNKWREYAACVRPLTLPKLLQLLAHKESVGQHVVSGLAAWFMARVAAGASPSRVAALDELLRAVLALASALVAARADDAVDDDEAVRLRAPMARVRRALERVEATLLPARAGHVVAIGGRS
jgi:hypothetical protein